MKTPNTINYVLGFLFTADHSRVALIRKNKPAWQAGLLNGIGGKIEEYDDSAFTAMTREFTEEAGFQYVPLRWSHFGRMGDGQDWKVELFAATATYDSTFDNIRSMEEEKVEIVDVANVNLTRTDMVENLPWLIAAALDFLIDGRPNFFTINYPAPKLP